MRTFFLVPIAAFFLVTACNNPRNPSSANFTTAINQYFAKHGEICAPIGRRFPIDIPRSEQNDQYGIAPKLAALEEAGLVNAIDTTAVVHGMLDPLRGSTPPQAVKHYELTDEGKKYFRQIPGTFGQTNGFCYGQKSVGSIVRWTMPITAASSSEVEVTYTYKLDHVAAWAGRSDVQQAFPDIRATFNEASKADQIVGLQLTDRGWEISGY